MIRDMKNLFVKVCVLLPVCLMCVIAGCSKQEASQTASEQELVKIEDVLTESSIAAGNIEKADNNIKTDDSAKADNQAETPDSGAKLDNKTEASDSILEIRSEEEVSLNPDFVYAAYSKINSGKAKLYRNTSSDKGKTIICVNAGHGTYGGGSVKTLSHPDGSPKVTGGTTTSGAVESTAISSGTSFLDGTSEASVTLAQALILKDMLYDAGYSVLMIRETEDVQLDNVARTVLANNYANCHIALHWDSTESDKGAFYIGVPDVASYKAMEPVASTWSESERFGQALISGLGGNGVKIYGSGCMALDLTQTSYSSVPSIDIELGDRASDHSTATLERNAGGILKGIDAYFGY